MSTHRPGAHLGHRRVRLRLRPAMDEVLGLVDDPEGPVDLLGLQAAATTVDEPIAGGGSLTFRTLDGPSGPVEQLESFVLRSPDRLGATFWADQGLASFGVHMARALGEVTPAPASAPAELQARLRARLQPLQAAFRVPSTVVQRPARRTVTSGPPVADPEAAARVAAALEGVTAALGRLRPADPAAAGRHGRLVTRLADLATRLRAAEAPPEPVVDAARAALGGGMGLAPQEIDQLRLGLGALRDRRTWDDAAAWFRAARRSLEGMRDE